MDTYGRWDHGAIDGWMDSQNTRDQIEMVRSCGEKRKWNLHERNYDFIVSPDVTEEEMKDVKRHDRKSLGLNNEDTGDRRSWGRRARIPMNGWSFPWERFICNRIVIVISKLLKRHSQAKSYAGHQLIHEHWFESEVLSKWKLRRDTDPIVRGSKEGEQLLKRVSFRTKVGKRIIGWVRVWVLEEMTLRLWVEGPSADRWRNRRKMMVSDCQW